MLRVRPDQENQVRAAPPLKTPGKATPKTPAPRDRPALGAKTTNLKTRALQTPVAAGNGKPTALAQLDQQRSTRAHKEIDQQQTCDRTGRPVEREPSSRDVSPDLPPPPGWAQPQRPRYDIDYYTNDLDKDIVVIDDDPYQEERERIALEEDEAEERLFSKLLKEQQEEWDRVSLEEKDFAPPIAAPPKRTAVPQDFAGPSSEQSKEAARALSSSSVPHFAQPTAAAKARQVTASASHMAPTRSSPTYTTIGRSKGRQIAAHKHRQFLIDLQERRAAEGVPYARHPAKLHFLNLDENFELDSTIDQKAFHLALEQHYKDKYGEERGHEIATDLRESEALLESPFHPAAESEPLGDLGCIMRSLPLR